MWSCWTELTCPSSKMSGDGFRLRAGTPHDGEQILNVHRRAILVTARSAYSKQEAESWAAGLVADRYGDQMVRAGERFQVATNEDGEIVGFCSVIENELMALYVDPEWSGNGVGSCLMSWAEQRIIDAGHSGIDIKASLNARSFYEDHGYSVVRQETFQSRGGMEMARLVMSKILV